MTNSIRLNDSGEVIRPSGQMIIANGDLKRTHTVGSAHPALPSTIAALALHHSTFNGEKDGKLLRRLLGKIASGEHVSEGTMQELLAQWNQVDADQLKTDTLRERLEFLKRNKVQAFEVWLPAAPEYLPTKIRSLIRSLDKTYSYSEARGNRDTRFVRLPNTKTGRAIFDEIVALGHVKLVIPRGSSRTLFYHEHGHIARDENGKRLTRGFGGRSYHLPVALNARQIERKAYIQLRISRSK